MAAVLEVKKKIPRIAQTEGVGPPASPGLALEQARNPVPSLGFSQRISSVPGSLEKYIV